MDDTDTNQNPDEERVTEDDIDDLMERADEIVGDEPEDVDFDELLESAEADSERIEESDDDEDFFDDPFADLDTDVDNEHNAPAHPNQVGGNGSETGDESSPSMGSTADLMGEMGDAAADQQKEAQRRSLIDGFEDGDFDAFKNGVELSPDFFPATVFFYEYTLPKFLPGDSEEWSVDTTVSTGSWDRSSATIGLKALFSPSVPFGEDGKFCSLVFRADDYGELDEDILCLKNTEDIYGVEASAAEITERSERIVVESAIEQGVIDSEDELQSE